MKYIISFLMTLLVCLYSACPSFALSDTDYKKFMKDSTGFAIADKKLSATWKSIKNTHSGKIPNALMAEQKRWIQVERDSEAKALFGKMTPADAYAEVTNRRIEKLTSMWLRKNTTQETSAQSNNRQGSATGIAGNYGYSREDPDGSTYSIFIEIKNAGNNKYHIDGFQQSITGVNHISKFKGTGEIINGILVAKGTIVDGFDSIRYESVILKIYNKPHQDLIQYGDEQINEAKRNNDAEMNKYYMERANKFKNLKESQIAILSEYGFIDVCSKE